MSNSLPKEPRKRIVLRQIDPDELGIKEERLSRIPLINHLQECAETYRLIHLVEFRDLCITNRLGAEIPALNIGWYGRTEELLTLLLQKAILGTESFLPGVVLQELVQRKLTNEKTREYIINPFSIKGEQGTADKFYNKLPELVDAAYSLRNADVKLWEDVRSFYQETRNPIFHGYLLNTSDPFSLQPYFEVIKRVFGWIDGWYEDKVGTIMPLRIKKFWPDVK